MLILKLADQVAQHAAGHLILQGVDVNAEYLRIHQAAREVFFTDRTEVVGDLQQEFLVDAGVVRRSLEGLHHDFSRRLRGAEGEGAHGGIDDVAARFDRAHVGHGGNAAGIVRMHLQRDLHGLLQSLEEFGRFVRDQQAGHVLDADRIRAHVLHLLRQMAEILDRVRFAEGIGNGRLDVAAFLLGRLHGGLEVAHVV